MRRPRRQGESHSAWEHAWHFFGSFGERVSALQAALSLDEGVEVRLPLFDARVVRLAAARPRRESSSAGDNKHLLRRAVRDDLPPEITAPRKRRTGLPQTYFMRTMREHLAFSALVMQQRSVLAELGVIDLGRFRTQAEAFVNGTLTDLDEVSAMSYTLQAELWLQSREGIDGARRAARPSPAPDHETGWAGAAASAHPTFPVVRTE
jgi:hypothetical protein